MNVAKDNKGNFVKKDAVLTCYSVNSVWRLNFCTTTLSLFLEPKGYPLLANAVRPFHKRPIAISGNAQAVATRFEHVEMILPGWLLAKSRMRIWYLDCVKCHFELKTEMRRCSGGAYICSQLKHNGIDFGWTWSEFGRARASG